MKIKKLKKVGVFVDYAFADTCRNSRWSNLFREYLWKKTYLRNLVSLLIRGPSCVKKATQKTRDTAPLRVLQCSRGSSNVSLILTIHSIIERNKGED